MEVRRCFGSTNGDFYSRRPLTYCLASAATCARWADSFRARFHDDISPDMAFGRRDARAQRLRQRAARVKWAYLNAQGQPKIEWPPSFALARAYADQIERKGCMAPTRLSSIRQSLANAEKGLAGAAIDAVATVDDASDRRCGWLVRPEEDGTAQKRDSGPAKRGDVVGVSQ